MNIKSKLLFAGFLIMFTGSFSSSIQGQNKYKAEWPSERNVTRPWTRWWWHGSAVNEKDLTANLEELKKAGFGGVEITSIYGTKGSEKQDISFLSPKWMNVLKYTIKEGQRLGLGIDLANASGWPFGGPWVSAEDACKDVHYKIYALKSGEKLDEKVELEQEPLVRAVGHNVDISEVKYPISSNTNLQELALDQVRFKRKLPLQALIAYNENGNKIELTNKVEKDGTVNWIAPDGNWKLYAVFQGWHGKQVERAGKGGEGDVIDHFSEKAVKNYLGIFDKNSGGIQRKGVRAFFNDSYEVDDAQGEGDWTPLLFDEFKKYRGYDLKEYLPALFGNDTEEMNQRVRCDYRETISDLLLDRFTAVWKHWSRNYHAVVRNQPHGSPANILDLYSASDIPETEGSSPLGIKLAASAGHVSGKPLISAEAATWLNEHFCSTLSEAKKCFDRYFANGVNHLVYHGTPYSPVAEEWPGWLFYASVHFAPTNTWWDDLKTINSYVSSCQSFLHSSKPANDILLYYPIYDAWSQKGKSMLQHFAARDEELSKGLGEMLLQNGYTFDYISDKQIQQLTVDDKNILSHNSEYKTIIIPNCDYIPLTTIQKIVRLAQKGATVILQHDFPKEVPGLHNAKQRQEEYKKMKDEIKFNSEAFYEGSIIGTGKIFKGNDVGKILEVSNVLPESMAKNGLWFNRVRREEGICYFISNWGDKDIDQWTQVRSFGKDAVWFNPMNKQMGKAEIRNIHEDYAEVNLKLDIGETLVLQWYPTTQDVEDYLFYEKTNDAMNLDGEWNVDFVRGGPTLPNSYTIKTLVSWTEHSNELKCFSGTASYKTTFKKPPFEGRAYMLDLGKVCESADVYLNGKKLETLVGPEYHLTIDGNKLKNSNNLEIQVTNLMANRISDMDKRGMNYKKFYNVNIAARERKNLDEHGVFTAKNWQPLESGLIGPVKLIGLRSKN
ncbi:MAG: glycoside hydrolase family 2 protein [Ignavibacteriae bacterium]|nr:MAG: glycoside hydrolase family 2 protein [Ignavibacteriota bacterium]